MIRASAYAVLLVVSAAAYADNASLSDIDSQAVVVTQDQTSPWLKAEVREGQIEHAGQGKTNYVYLHLLTPINFVAATRKDNFSENVFHVYDLSFAADAGEPSVSRMESMVGKTIEVQGRVSAVPTAHVPVSMHISVTASKL